jgi:hypothetical protein
MEETTFPPEILFPGARQSHDVKCLAFAQAFKSRPHSLTSFKVSEGPNPQHLVLAAGQGLRPRCLSADGSRQSKPLPD